MMMSLKKFLVLTVAVFSLSHAAQVFAGSTGYETSYGAESSVEDPNKYIFESHASGMQCSARAEGYVRPNSIAVEAERNCYAKCRVRCNNAFQLNGPVL